ncbi:MAG: sugar ABC transporter substrate-binding protein [Caldanaerobacter subterraneus]|nr:sugar ABC transporter substrate-binding protein [Caldanaerobacter subterraneus]
MKNLAKLLYIAVSLILVFALFVSGCSPKQQPETSQAPSSEQKSEPAKKVTLDFVWFTDGVEGQVMKEIIADYQKEHPNVEINLIEVPYDDLEAKLKTMITGGKPPALARVTNPGAFASAALDLTPYLGDKDQFMSQFLDGLKYYCIVEGKLIAAPMEVTANGLIYNKTLFDKAGVKVPQSPDEVWTWDEFAKAIKEVKAKTGAKYGVVWDPTPHRWTTLLYEFGGSIFNSDATDTNINKPEAVEALNYFKKLVDEDVVSKATWLGGENANNIFRSGTAAAHLSGSWMISNYRDTIKNFEWGVTYLPKAKVRSSVLGAKFVMAFKNSGVEKEAGEFIKYLASKEVDDRYVKESLFLSPRKNPDVTYDFGTEFFKIFSNELAVSPPPASYDWSRQDIIPKFTSDLKEAIVSVLQGKQTAQQALDHVAELAKQAIKEAQEGK